MQSCCILFSLVLSNLILHHINFHLSTNENSSGGNIAIEPEPNYGEFPTVSKEYAKLRKEYQQKRPNTKWNSKDPVTEDSNVPFYVIAETSNSSTSTKTLRIPGNSGTTRHFTGTTFNPSTKNPYYYNPNPDNSANSEHSRPVTIEEKPFSGVYYATSNYELHNINYRRPISTTYKPKQVVTAHYVVNAITDEASTNQKSTNHEEFHAETVEDAKILDQQEAESTLDGRVNRRVDNGTGSNQNTTDTTEELMPTTEATKENTNTTESLTTAFDYITTQNISEDTTITTDNVDYEVTTLDLPEPNSSTLDYTETIQPSSIAINEPVTVKTITNSTDCLQEVEKRVDVLEDRNDYDIPDMTTMELADANGTKNADEEDESSSTLTSTQHEVTEVDLEFKVNVATASSSLMPKIEPIENVTKNKEDTVDYDYNDLPPSLPNLQYV